MKIWTSEHTFNHPWETVAQAAWRKYPNPMNPAVLGTDVVERQVVNGVLHTHRLVSSKWGIPGWAQRLVGPSNICYASEQSEVNPTKRHMELKTRNLTFGSFIAVDETLSYQPHPEDKTKTLLKQEAVVTVQGIPLNSYMEDILTKTIMLNANKGRQAIEWVIGIIDKEVTDLKLSAAKSTDELKKSLESARRSMDEFSTSAKKTLDDIHNLTSSTNIPEF
ncbi:protein slowmo-like [Macrosteles quadrilineatus]|uniref:protein slowmo-like n=1 Tax=Macrosteles quadrilineatus TaxID=74068 RepID=UPI0023E1DFB5|nr:protein slowmo-like [Macrosteles quadrilineatus]XP_054283777.1 protein slowmo-like [Macrosteles quadrilineatus]